MLQNRYDYNSQRGVPGGIFDSSPRSVISRANGETTPTAVKYGFGVVRGDVPGTDVKLPTNDSTANMFEGVVVQGISEHDLDGAVRNNPTKMLGILDWGKVWVRVPDGLTVAYGDKAYLITNGQDAGKFTNDDEDTLDVNAIFITAVDSGDIAAIKLYDAPRA